MTERRKRGEPWRIKMKTGPFCPRCGQPLLEDNGEVKPHVKIEQQRKVIEDLRAQLAAALRRIAPDTDRGPSARDYDDPITMPSLRK